MQRPLQVAYKGMESSPTIDAIIARRVGSLEERFPRMLGCRIVLEIPYRADGSGKEPLGVSIEVDMPGHPLIVAKDSGERRDSKGDHMAPINAAFDAVERQMGKLQDIRQQPVSPAADGETGAIASLFPDEGYGFVEIDGSPELYFTRTAVAGNYDELRVGMLVHVTRATTEGPMGPQASSVRLLGRQKNPNSFGAIR